jgi:hypothetical protein
MQQPLGFLALAGRADQGQPDAVEGTMRTAVHGDDDLVVVPLLGFVPAVVPDRDCASAVLPAGDLALERRVLQRVILGLDREMVAGRCVGNPLRHRPAHQNPIALQPEVVVQPPRVMLLHHECGSVIAAEPGPGGVLGHRFGCARGGAFANVGPQGSVVRPVGADGQHSRQQIAGCRDAPEHLLEFQVTEVRIVELVPAARRGDRGPEPPPQ